jgi:O-6-methylguanine DNA methyltransferase
MKMSIESQLAGLRRAAPPSLEVNVDLGTGLADGYRVYESPVGEVAVVFNPHGVAMVRLAEEDFEDEVYRASGKRVVAALPPRGWDASIGRAIEQGTPGTLPLDLRSVSPFRRKILEVATTIPRGQVRPYAWLARQAGRDGAARAVGSAMANNPVPLIVPCHRVVRSDGTIGAYSLGGPHNKWTLLAEEGADPARLQTEAESGVRYFGSDTTRIFCYPTCQQARRISPDHLVRLHSTAEASAMGYRGCLKCRPA